MFKLFKISFKKANDCLILAVPLVIFLSVLGWYLNFAINSVDETGKLICAAITFFVMFCGFTALWLYMVKKILPLSGKIYVFEKDRAKDLWETFLSLPKGIGRLFVPAMGVTAVYLLAYTLIFLAVNYFVSKYAGAIDFNSFDINLYALSFDSFTDAIETLEPAEIRILEIWYISMFLSMLAVSFVTILWIPEIVYGHKNSFKALFSSILKVFANFGETFILFVYIAFIVKLLSVVNTILLFAPAAYFFVLLATCYFIVYLVVLLFTYYERKFINAAE